MDLHKPSCFFLFLTSLFSPSLRLFLFLFLCFPDFPFLLFPPFPYPMITLPLSSPPFVLVTLFFLLNKRNPQDSLYSLQPEICPPLIICIYWSTHCMVLPDVITKCQSVPSCSVLASTVTLGLPPSNAHCLFYCTVTLIAFPCSLLLVVFTFCIFIRNLINHL